MAKKPVRSARSKTIDRSPAAPPMPARPTWTFMLYLAGDNNLGDEMIWALKDVFRVGVPDGVAVTAHLDLPSARGVRVFRPTSAFDGDGVLGVAHHTAGPERDSGAPDPLVDFVYDSIQAAPADHYMLILAGHGAGVLGSFLTDHDAAQRHFQQPGSLAIADLSAVFTRLRTRLPRDFHEARAGRPTLDVLGMDSCLMSMAEVCSEIRGEVSLLIGSEGFEPNTGWPYFRLLERIGELSPADLAPGPLARRLVRRYVTYYSDYLDAGISVDLSVCDVGDTAMTALEDAIRAFVAGYRAEIARPDGAWIDAALVQAHWRAQSYKGELYVDIADVFALLADECHRLDTIAGHQPDSAYVGIAALAERVADAVDNGDPQVVVFCDTSGPDFQYSRGLSIYFPWSLRQYEERYHLTRFAARTAWDTFLEEHLHRTQRPPRAVVPAGPGLPGSVDDEIVLLRDMLGQPLDAGAAAGRTSAPVTRTAAPVTRTSPPTTRTSAPTTRTSAPVTRTSAPVTRTSAPVTRTSAPVTRTSAPVTRTSAPVTRTSAPVTRFAADMDALLQDLPSRMKNPATEVVPVIRLDARTAADVAAVPDEAASPDLRMLKTALEPFAIDRGAARAPRRSQP